MAYIPCEFNKISEMKQFVIIETSSKRLTTLHIKQIKGTFRIECNTVATEERFMRFQGDFLDSFLSFYVIFCIFTMSLLYVISLTPQNISKLCFI